jgi:hypothetical protein
MGLYNVDIRSNPKEKIMTNDFIYDMSEINEEEIVKGWEELVNEENEADYIPGLDDGEGWDPIMGDDDEWPETDDEWLDDFQGEEDFA